MDTTNSNITIVPPTPQPMNANSAEIMRDKVPEGGTAGLIKSLMMKQRAAEVATTQVADQPAVASAIPEVQEGSAVPESDQTQIEGETSHETVSEQIQARLEKIQVMDDKGRRDIEVDFNDVEKLKKYVQMAHGARKWQVERDQALAKAASLQEKYQKVETNFDAIDKAYTSDGVEGVIDLLQGRRGAYKDWVEAQVKRADFIKYASPEQLEALESKEQLSKMTRALELQQKQNEEFQKKITAEREEADAKALEATVTPIFEKYRFKGKLGNAEEEQMFDQILWDTAQGALGSKAEITQSDIEAEFKRVASMFRNRISTQAEKTVNKVIAQKKQEATENAQAAIRSNYTSKDAVAQKEMADILARGDYTSLFRGMKKFGGLLRK